MLERNVKRLSNIQSKESDEVIKTLRDSKNKIESEIKDNEEKQRQGLDQIKPLTLFSDVISTVRLAYKEVRIRRRQP